MTAKRDGYFIAADEMAILIDSLNDAPYKVAAPIIRRLAGCQKVSAEFLQSDPVTEAVPASKDEVKSAPTEASE